MDKLFIGVREFSRIMGVSGKTIYRMLNDNHFPFAVKIGGQWRFHKETVDNWIAIQTQSQSGAKKEKVNYGVSVAAALGQGTVLYRIQGKNRDEALDAILETFIHTPGINFQNIKLSVLIRESLASSCLKEIAGMMPSPDHPVYMDRSLVIFAFLETPANFKALDKKLAKALYLILGANFAEQSILETRLRRLMMENEFVENLLQSPGKKELEQLIADWEAKLF